MRRTKGEAISTAKEMSARGDQGAQFFSKIKGEALGLFGVLLGGKGAANWVKDTTKSLADLGRNAHNLNMAPGELQAFRMTISRNGGSADEAVSNLEGVQARMEQYRTTGILDEGMRRFIQQTGAQPNETPMQMFQDFARFADAHRNDPALIQQVGRNAGFGQSLINEAERGYAQFMKDQADSIKEGVPTEQQTKAAQDLQRAFTGLGQTLDHIGDVILGKAAPALTTVLDDFTEFAEKHPAGAVGAIAGGTVASGWIGGRLLRSALRWLGIGGKTAAAGEGAATAGGEAAAAEAVGTAIGWGFFRFIIQKLPWVGAITSLLIPSNTEGQGEKDQTAAFNAAHAGDIIPPTVDNRSWWERHAPSWAGGKAAPVGNLSANQTALSNQAMAYFTANGLTANAAAGLVGNLMQESGLQVGAGAGTAHQGIAQWDSSRRAAIEAHFGKPLSAMSYHEQLAAVLWEAKQKQYASVAQAANAMKQISQAAFIWDHGYEAPGNYDVEDPRRAALAERAAKAFGGVDPGLNPSMASSSGGSGAVLQHHESATHIGHITVNTKATDARGIAKDLDRRIKEQADQANYTMGY